jgi:transcriptional regulator with XRE-family HTH domain
VIVNYKQELRDLGSKIKHLRTEKKLTQINLAALCDIDVRSVQMIERGELNMSLKIFFSLAVAFEVSPCGLLNKEENTIKSTN